MQYLHAQPGLRHAPEVVLNLWAYSDEGGYILRLAGKAYVMENSDAEKLGLLRMLSGTDFLSASWRKVPTNFKMTGPAGDVMQGIAHASMLSDPNTHGFLFDPLMNELANALPEQARSINGEYLSFKLELPESPLCITTIIMEYEDGRLVPMVSGQK